MSEERAGQAFDEDEDDGKPLLGLERVHTDKMAAKRLMRRAITDPRGNPTPDRPYNRARPRTIPRSLGGVLLGEAPPMPKITIERVEATGPNPLLDFFEPYVPPPARPEVKDHDYAKSEPRRVGEADIDVLLAWMIEHPDIRRRFPRCTVDSVRPFLLMATRGGRLAFMQTDNAVGLYATGVTPWEPELVAEAVFVISRVTSPFEVTALYEWGRDWANQIGAITYSYAGPDDLLTPIAHRLGHDVEAGDQIVTRYVHNLKRE